MAQKKIKADEVQMISLSELKPFEDAPFKVRFDDNMNELIESVKDSGVLVPLIARPHAEGGYEILAGHRRAKASELANYRCNRSNTDTERLCCKLWRTSRENTKRKC